MDTEDNRSHRQSRIVGRGGPHPEAPDAGAADRQNIIAQLRQNIRRLTSSDRKRAGVYFDQLRDAASHIPPIRLFQDDDSDSDIAAQH